MGSHKAGGRTRTGQYSIRCYRRAVDNCAYLCKKLRQTHRIVGGGFFQAPKEPFGGIRAGGRGLVNAGLAIVGSYQEISKCSANIDTYSKSHAKSLRNEFT